MLDKMQQLEKELQFLADNVKHLTTRVAILEWTKNGGRLHAVDEKPLDPSIPIWQR